MSGVSWHGAGGNCTRLDRKARSGCKRCRANRIHAGEQEHAQLRLGFLGATKKSALQQDPDGERRLRTQGPGSKKLQEALTENKVGRRKKEKAGHMSGKDQARWSTPLTSTNSHPTPRSRVSVTDFAVVRLTCAKAGQYSCPSSDALQWPLLAPQTQRAACGF